MKGRILRKATFIAAMVLGFAAVGGIGGYFAGSAPMGAVLLGLVGLYVSSTNAAGLMESDPRTRGRGGGGNGGV